MHTNVIRTQIESPVLATSRKRRSVTAVWSNDETDHYDTAFIPAGIDTSTFAKNPIILWEHGKSHARETEPVAYAHEFGVDRYQGRNCLIGTSQFVDDEFSEKIFQNYAWKLLRGWSINLKPTDSSPPTPAEQRARPDWMRCKTVYREGVLLEVSATSLPGNPNALTIGVERHLSRNLDAALIANPFGMSDHQIEVMRRMSSDEQAEVWKAINRSVDVQIGNAVNKSGLESAAMMRKSLASRSIC